MPIHTPLCNLFGIEHPVLLALMAGVSGGARATLPFVPAVVDIANDIPVIAAGGIANGRGLAAALALGASGVLCGTAFFASNESLASDNAKQVVVSGSGDNTERSSVFDLARPRLAVRLEPAHDAQCLHPAMEH
jgi:nitronate monooxygenase